jgi:Fe/S biogenesis protein NfuA
MSIDTPATSPLAPNESASTEPAFVPSGSTGDVVMRVSDDALSTVRDIRSAEPDPAALALRVAITGTKGVEYTYDLSFEEIDSVDEDHVRYTVEDLTVVIPNDSVEFLRGAELDLPKSAGQGGLVIRNPNRADPLANVNIELTGDVAEKVTQLLEGSINPMLAAHGGFATLVGVDEKNNVYLTMGGGCQGCSASAATLTDGIQQSIRENIPEVLEVIDATDHASGENPFYS